MKNKLVVSQKVIDSSGQGVFNCPIALAFKEAGFDKPAHVNGDNAGYIYIGWKKIKMSPAMIAFANKWDRREPVTPKTFTYKFED